jgi:hypothetical protein
MRYNEKRMAFNFYGCQICILLFLRQPVGYNEVGYLSSPCLLDLFAMEGSPDMKSC